MFLKAYFDKCAQINNYRKLAKKMIAAIRNEDIDEVKKLWDSIEDKQIFPRVWKPYVNLVTDSDIGTLIMKAAIDTNNLEIFQACFKHMPDPNFSLYYLYSSPSGSSVSSTSILKYAVENDKDKIAMFLANHPALDTSQKDNLEVIMQASEKTSISALNALLAEKAPQNLAVNPYLGIHVS